MIFVDDYNPELKTLNEAMLMKVSPSLSPKIENSVLYPKLKALLFTEIALFTREKVELREDLNILRMNIGEPQSEEFIREYMNDLKEKYNSDESNNIGIDFHIEQTRVDFALIVFVIIKRSDLYIKKFVFRFKKVSAGDSMKGLSQAGLPIDDESKRLERLNKIFNGDINE